MNNISLASHITLSLRPRVIWLAKISQTPGRISTFSQRPSVTYSGAANDQIWGWTQTGGRPSSIIHQMKANNLRVQKLRDAGTEKLYKPSYCIVSMATFFK